MSGFWWGDIPKKLWAYVWWACVTQPIGTSTLWYWDSRLACIEIKYGGTMKFNVQLHDHDFHQVMDENLEQNNSSQSQCKDCKSQISAASVTMHHLG